MSVRRAPLPAYSPRSEPARIYGALWAEIREHLEAAPRVAAAAANSRYPESDDAVQHARM